MNTFNNKIVYHVLQNVYEYYKRGQITGAYAPVCPAVAENWPAGSIQYIELRHNQAATRGGSYGQFINW